MGSRKKSKLLFTIGKKDRNGRKTKNLEEDRMTL